MSLGCEEFIEGYFITVTTSSERIYVRVRWYKPGSSVEQPPDTDKTAILENNEINRRFVKAYKHTLCEYIAQLPVLPDGYVVIKPQLTKIQKKLLDEQIP